MYSLFEIELIICIKIHFALNNLQRLICHKTQTTRTYPLDFLLRITHTHTHTHTHSDGRANKKICMKKVLDTMIAEHV